MNRPRVLIVSWYGPGMLDSGERIRLRGATSAFYQRADVAWAIIDSSGKTGVNSSEFLYVPPKGVDYEVSARDYLRASLRGEAIEEFALGRRKGLRGWMERIVRDFAPDLIWANQPFVWPLLPEACRARVCLDTHNVNSERLARIASSSRSRAEALGARLQVELTRRFERQYVEGSATTVVVSEDDMIALSELHEGKLLGKIAVIPNGTTLDINSVTRPLNSGERPSLLFLGSLGYSANIDALECLGTWLDLGDFDLSVSVVGSGDPSKARLICERHQGLKFVGFVDDVRVEMRKHHALIAPHRQGGGSRIKVLEALGTRLPVIGTRVAVEGLKLDPGKQYLEVDGVVSLSRAIESLRSRDVVRSLVGSGWSVAVHNQWPVLSERALDVALDSVDRSDG